MPTYSFSTSIAPGDSGQTTWANAVGAALNELGPLVDAKAPLASPAFTGTPTAPTASTGTNTTQIATTAYVKAQGYATLASPTFTGTPAAPTAASTTNTTQIATTAFVKTSVGLYNGVNAQTGTTYAPVLADAGKLVTLSNAGAITVTMPSDATTAFPVGSIIDFAAINTGMATFVAGSSATVKATPSAITRANGSAVSAIKYAANSWLIVGDLA
jgi:hypothetical protein